DETDTRRRRGRAGAGDLSLLARADDRPDGGGGGVGRRTTTKVQGEIEGGTMIASIRGEVLDIALDHVVIEACGVGYKVMTTPSTLATLHRGSEARLITAMIVREDSQTLYGFADADARDLFLTLLGVSGVGPKIALATLAVYDAPSLRQAHGARIARQDRLDARRFWCRRAQRSLGARTGRRSACRTWLCAQAGR